MTSHFTGKDLKPKVLHPYLLHCVYLLYFLSTANWKELFLSDNKFKQLMSNDLLHVVHKHRYLLKF